MYFIKFILASIPLIGFASYLFKKDVQRFYIPIIVLSLLIFALYLFAIFDQLVFGFYVFALVGYLLFLLNLRYIYTEISKRISISNWTLLLYLLPFLVVLNSIPNNFQLSYWDEFADWGMSIKYMFSEDRLYSYWREGYFNYGHYPPAQQLLQYYFLKFIGWSEACLIWVELSFLLLIQLSFFGAQRKNYFLGALMFCASLAVPAYFHFFYNNIYVDLFLSLYFASTFLFLLTSKNSVLENVIACLMLFILVQIKQVALVFSFILLASYFAKVIISYCSIINGTLVFSPVLMPKKKGKFNDAKLPLIFSVSATCAIFLSYYSWSFFKKFNGVLSNKSESIPSLIKFFENPIADRLRDTTHLFIIRLSESSFTLGIKFYYIILLLILFGSFLALLINKTRKFSDFSMLLLVGFGSIFYFVFVLLAYILFFSYEEGIVLSGFERYTAIYLIAWVMILLGYIVQKTLPSLPGKAILILVSSILLFVVPPRDFYKIISQIKISDGVLQDRKKVDALVDQLQILSKQSRVYFIAQGYGGFIHRVFQYSASPMHVSSGCHSFGEKYHTEDSDTCNIRLEGELKGYDYLALYYGDKQFWRDYQTLFPLGFSHVESGVFKVNIESGGRVALTPLGSIK